MYWDITLKMLLGSVMVFIIFRLIGKKAISELTPFDLLYVLVLGGLLESSIFIVDVTIPHLIYSLILWAVVVFIIERTLAKTIYISKYIQGEPSILVREGKIDLEELDKNHFDMEQLRGILRQHDCHALKDAYYVILEVNGGVTVIKKEDQVDPSVLLVEKGTIRKENLESLEKDEEWLLNKLKEDYDEIDKIVYAEWLPEGRLFVYTEEETNHREMKLDG